jgi:hypothetical protein
MWILVRCFDQTKKGVYQSTYPIWTKCGHEQKWLAIDNWIKNQYKSEEKLNHLWESVIENFETLKKAFLGCFFTTMKAICKFSPNISWTLQKVQAHKQINCSPLIGSLHSLNP